MFMQKHIDILMSSRIIWLLLKHGARVTQRNKLGLTAFHFAAANGNSQALQVYFMFSLSGLLFFLLHFGFTFSLY